MEVITTTGNATSYTDDGTDANGPKFAHGEWPHYRVAAVNRAGTGPFSDPEPAGGDTAPEFPAAETGERSVLESAPESAIVGDPVAVTDAGSEPLTYTLGRR